MKEQAKGLLHWNEKEVEKAEQWLEHWKAGQLKE